VADNRLVKIFHTRLIKRLFNSNICLNLRVSKDQGRTKHHESTGEIQPADVYVSKSTKIYGVAKLSGL
jgi:hypothetical protein